MKKNLSKILSVAMAMLLTASVVTGCQGSEEPNNTGNDGNSSDPDNQSDDLNRDGPVDPTAFDETLTVTAAVMTGFTQSGSEVERNLEEKYNLDIELVVLPGWSDGQARINLLMQSDDVPDIMWWWGMENDFIMWKEAGLLADVSEYLNTYTNIRDYYNKMNPMTLFYATEEDGAVYRIPGDVAEPGCEVLWIRQDWLDNLNLDVPTTIEELEEVLRAFTEDDPDGNGVDDTYGLGGDGYDFRSFWPWIQGYDQTHFSRWTVSEDGAVGYGPANDNSKYWLEEVAELYAAGYITPNITQDTDRDEEMANGGFGVTYSWVAWNNPESQTMISFYNSNPDAQWVPIEMVEGSNGNPQEHPDTSAAWAYFGITSSAEDPERLFAFYDDMSSVENYVERRFGTEGVHYTYDEDGIYQPIIGPDSEENTAQNIGLKIFDNMFNRKDEGNISNTLETSALFERVDEQSRDAAAQYIEWRNSADLTVWTRVRTDIEDEKDRFFWSVIGGQESIENWDTFISTINGLGLQDAIDEAQEIYDTQSALVDEYMENQVNQQ